MLDLDIFTAGFVCKLYSQESTKRYASGRVEDFFHGQGETVAWIDDNRKTM